MREMNPEYAQIAAEDLASAKRLIWLQLTKEETETERRKTGGSEYPKTWEDHVRAISEDPNDSRALVLKVGLERYTMILNRFWEACFTLGMHKELANSWFFAQKKRTRNAIDRMELEAEAWTILRVICASFPMEPGSNLMAWATTISHRHFTEWAHREMAPTVIGRKAARAGDQPLPEELNVAFPELDDPDYDDEGGVGTE